MRPSIDFFLRPAAESDFPAIRALILAAQINPLGLDWRRFWVAVSFQGEVIGCGQIKSHGRSAQERVFELASISVMPVWRGQGVARAVIERLLASHPGRLYLTCRASLEPFYTKFGFRAISEAEQQSMPPYFRRLSQVFRSLRGLRVVGETLLVMQRDENAP